MTMSASALVEWTRVPEAISAESLERMQAFLLQSGESNTHAERTALIGVLMELAACKQATPKKDGEDDLSYYQRLLVTYEQHYAPERARYERHLRARLANALMRAAVRSEASAVNVLAQFFNSQIDVGKAVTELLAGTALSSLSSSSRPSGGGGASFTSKWNTAIERLRNWTPSDDVELNGKLFRLPTQEKAILDGIVEDLHSALRAVSGERTATLQQLDAALLEQITEGDRARATADAAQVLLIASLSDIFERVNARWQSPSQEDYVQPVAYVNERVAIFDAAMRAWKRQNEVAARKLDVLQTLVTSINEMIELPRLYGGSGTVGRPFSAQMIKNAPQHLKQEFELWVAEHYTEPKARATRDVASYKAAIEKAMTTMVGEDRTSRDLATPLGAIVSLDNLDNVTTLTANVDTVRQNVAKAAAEYARQLDTLKRLLATLNEVVKDATRAIDPAAAVPALDRLSNPEQYVKAVVDGKNAERVRRANDLKELVLAVELVVNSIDPAMWNEWLQLPSDLASTIQAPAPAVPAPSAPEAREGMTALKLRTAFDDIKRRTSAFAADSNKNVASFFATAGGSGDYIDLLQRVMADLLARVQQRGALIAQRAQQLSDTQETLFNLTRNGADVLFSGANAERLPSKSDMVGVDNAIKARTHQRLKARYALYTELHHLVSAFNTVHGALALPIRVGTRDDPLTPEEQQQTNVKTDLGALRQHFLVSGVLEPEPRGDHHSQHLFGNDNSFYEARLSELAALTANTQSVLYAFIQRTRHIDETRITAIENLYTLVRNGADAIARDSTTAALPPKDQADAVYQGVLARANRRSALRGELFDTMATYVRTFDELLRMLGMDNEHALTTHFYNLAKHFYTLDDAINEWNIDAAKREQFVGRFHNDAYEKAVTGFAEIITNTTPTLYDLIGKRQEVTRHLSAIDTAYTLLSQAFNAVYDERDAAPFPSKSDAPKQLGTVLKTRLDQRVEALGKLFDTLTSYLRAIHTAVVALNTVLVKRYQRLAGTDRVIPRNATTGELIVPNSPEYQLIAQDLVFFDRLVRLLAFFDPPTTEALTSEAQRAANKAAFADRQSSAVFDERLRAVSSLITDGSLQAMVATLVQRERQSAEEMSKLDSVYALLQTLADTIYSGKDAQRLSSRDKAVELPAQVKQRQELRTVQRKIEAENVGYLLVALAHAITALGTTLAMVINLPALQSAVDGYLTPNREHPNQALQDAFLDSAQRGNVIAVIGAAVRQVQQQAYSIASAAEQETNALSDAVQVGYTALSNMAAQLGAQPALPSLKDVRANPQALTAAVSDRVASFQGNVATTRESLKTALNALWIIVDAMDMSAYTMSRTELLQAAPALQSNTHTSTLGLHKANDDPADESTIVVDDVTLPEVLRYLIDVANDLSFNSFSALRVATEMFARALSVHSAARIQLLTQNHKRGETLVKQIESLSESVIRQVQSMFARDVAVPRLSGFEAASQVQAIWQQSVIAQFNKLAERMSEARAAVDGIRATAKGESYSPGAYVYTDTNGLMSGQETAINNALASITTIRDAQIANARELSTLLTTSRAAYDKAEALVKDIERVARAYDATKVAVELESKKQSFAFAVGLAKTAITATGMTVENLNALDNVNSVAQMVTIQNTLEAAIKTQRADFDSKKDAYEKATTQAKNIERVARAYDAEKAARDVESARQSLALARDAAKAAITATSIPLDNMGALDGIDTGAMATFKANLEASIKAKRDDKLQQKLLVEQATEQAKAIAQVARTYDAEKALQESVRAYSDMLDAYRAVADTLTVAMIAYRRGRESMPYAAFALVRQALGNTNVRQSTNQVHSVLVAPPGGLNVQLQVSPLAKTLHVIFTQQYTPAMITLLEYATNILRLTVDQSVPPNNDVQAARVARVLFLDDWPNGAGVTLASLSAAAASSGVDGMSQRRHFYSLLQAANIRAESIFGITINVASQDALNAAFQAWINSIPGAGAPVPPVVAQVEAWVGALFVFLWRYMALAMLFVPTVVADPANDVFSLVRASTTSLAVCVGHQLELFARIGAPPPLAFVGAKNAAADVRAALGGLAKRMANKNSLREGQTLDTGALGSAAVAEGIFAPARAAVGGMPLIPPAGGGGGGGGAPPPAGGGGGARPPRPSADGKDGPRLREHGLGPSAEPSEPSPPGHKRRAEVLRSTAKLGVEVAPVKSVYSDVAPVKSVYSDVAPVKSVYSDNAF